MAIADVTGAVQERYTYSAYGTVEVRNPDFTGATNNQSTFGWTVLYTGQSLDTETGLYLDCIRS